MVKSAEKVQEVREKPGSETRKPASLGQASERAAGAGEAAEKTRPSSNSPEDEEAGPSRPHDRSLLAREEPVRDESQLSGEQPEEHELDGQQIQRLLRERGRSTPELPRNFEPPEGQAETELKPGSNFLERGKLELTESQRAGLPLDLDRQRAGLPLDQLTGLQQESTLARFSADAAPADGAEDQQEPTELENTAQVLLDHLDQLDQAAGRGGRDGKIGREDLEAVANDPNASPELREAAQAALGNENYLNALDLGAGGGDVDREIARDDLEAVIREEQQNPQRLSIEETAAIVRDNFELFDTASGGGGKDQEIGREDLQAISTNEELPAEVREAARALLENDNYHHALDIATGRGDLDGKIGLRDVNAAADRGFLDNPEVAQDPTASLQTQDNVLTIAQNFDALDTAADGGNPDGVIGRRDLQAALDDPSTPPELRQAVMDILANPAALNALDVGSGQGKVDGKFDRGDIVDFVRSGLDRAAENAHEQDEIFSAFMAEYGQFLPPEELTESREAQRLESAHAGHEALAENFTQLFEDERFQDVVQELGEDEKIDLIEQISQDLTGTVSGQQFIDEVVGDVAAIGRGELQSSDNVFARFITDGRRVERSANQAYNNALNALIAPSLYQAKDARTAIDLLDGFVAGSFSPQDAQKFQQTVGAEFRNVANLVDSIQGTPTPEQVAELNQARQRLADRLQEANARNDSLGRGKPLGNTLNVGAVVFDAFAISQHDFGEDLLQDTVLLASTARDVADVGKIAATSLSRGAQSLIGRAAIAAGAGDSAALAGTRLAGGLGRAVPILGAAASFASAIASFHDDKLGFAADVLSGVGFTAIAAAPLFGPAAPVAATLGAVAVGVGGAIRLGQALYDVFTESEEERAQQRYDAYSRQILSEAYGGDGTRVQDLVGLSDEAKFELSEVATQMGVPPHQLYEEMREEWLSAGRPGELSDFILS